MDLLFSKISKPIPVLNMMSIDNVKFYVGGHDISIDSKFMLVEEEQFCNFLADYWNTLWSAAKPLNDTGQIHWDAVKEIGQRVGLSDQDFDAAVKKWSDWAAQERKKYPK